VKPITVTYSTMGQANPHQLGADRDYVWNGDPAKSEAARKAGRTPPPRSTRAGSQRGGDSHQRREERLLVFAAALTEELARGTREVLAVREAGKHAGVGADTARVYRRLLEQRREARDG
jgi:hypothetical protein